MLLCGGESRRMGRDKALVAVQGRTLIERSLAALCAVADQVWLASGSEPRYPHLGLTCVLDVEPGAGPLAGLAAGLRACSTPWLAVLSCDLPLAEGEMLRGLLVRAEAGGWDAALLGLPRGSQPLFAVYRTATCAPAVSAALRAGERRMVSFHGGLRVVSVAAVELGGAAERAGINLNTPEDLRSLEQDRPSADTMGSP